MSGRGKRAHDGAVLEELVRELRHLRNLVREVGENVILRREGEVEAVIGTLAELSPGQLRVVADGLLEELRKLKVKPGKGRLKDLKGLDSLIEDVAGRVSAAQDKGRLPAKG